MDVQNRPCAAQPKIMEMLQKFYSINTTMGEEVEKRRLLNQRPKRARKAGAAAAAGTTSSRHVAWTDEDASHYQLVRKGIPLANTAEADHLFETKRLEEAHFYLWKHNDPHLERNPSVPKWEATYYFEDRKQHARVKKCHLKVAYQGAQRVSHDEMWTLDAQTRLPYWVDRYAFSKLKQRSSKRKYEDNKRAPDKVEASHTTTTNSTE